MSSGNLSQSSPLPGEPLSGRSGERRGVSPPVRSGMAGGTDLVRDEDAMTDSFERLMAAVLRAPRDDAPRLRLADWLAASGDPRGEFIRVQVELARLDPAADEADRLARRERELLARHETEWVGPLAGWLLGWTF